ncbi:ATPase [Sphingomonas sp. GlSt437]|uniref:F0F1 ATP synthase subunit B family protein n=1 Tax=Sphingomonas sp. GlSt437 TaxID=3389970 RepID=UPI003A86D9C8
MPQFEFGTVFWPQVFWLAVFFVVLYFGVVGPTLPKLGRVMAERENKVTGDIAQAEAAKADADALQASHDASVAVAQDKARALVAEARSKANAKVEAKLKDANAKLDAQAKAADAALAQARGKALAEIEAVAADAAATIVDKLTGVRPADNAAQAAARAALG